MGNFKQRKSKLAGIFPASWFGYFGTLVTSFKFDCRSYRSFSTLIKRPHTFKTSKKPCSLISFERSTAVTIRFF